MDITGLHKVLTAKDKWFRKKGDTIQTPDGPLTHIDRGGNVLAVAHLDWVKWTKKPKITKQYNNYIIEDTPQLDDRLGAWMCLDVLPRAGIVADVLLTDNEECGRTTAQHFETSKKYNWIMEFDRQGGGVAMYEYEDDLMEELMRTYDYTVDQGSFTDICELQSLGCKGFNFGVGYHKQHTDKCYANLAETFDSFRKVQSFYKDWKDTHLEHEEVYSYRGNWNLSGGWHTSAKRPATKVYNYNTKGKIHWPREEIKTVKEKEVVNHPYYPNKDACAYDFYSTEY